MEIEFQGQHNQKQYYQAIFLAGQPSRRSLILRILIFIVFTSLLTALAIETLQDGEATEYQIVRIGRHLITALILAYFIFRPYISIYQTANRLWQDPFVRMPYKGSISSQGISLFGQLTPWEQYLTRHITDELIVVMTADRTMTALPRHFFQDQKDWERVRELVLQKVVEAR
jgi:hypothetical protein